MIRAMACTLAIFLLLSCEGNNDTQINFGKANTFIDKPGKYYFENIIVLVKELKDNTLTFAISDDNTNLVYQHNLFSSFSKYSYWKIFIDNEENIWFINSDYSEFYKLIRRTDNTVEIVDVKKEKPQLPDKLKSELKGNSPNYLY